MHWAPAANLHQHDPILALALHHIGAIEAVQAAGVLEGGARGDGGGTVAGEPLPDLVLVLAPLGFCCLPVICLGPQKIPFGVPKLAPRADLGACSDRTNAPQQQERLRSIAYKLNG